MSSFLHLPDAMRNRISGLSSTSDTYDNREMSWCTTTMTSLRLFRCCGRKLSDIPVFRLPNVTHLEIKSMATYDGYAGLGATLSELRQLRSLSLMCITLDQTNVFSEVASAMPLLPNLSALALQHVVTTQRLPPSTVALLCEALRGCVSLRRVYWDHALSRVNLPTYMETIATHRDLEAFHLVVRDERMCGSLLRYICRHLPPRLSVLSLSSMKKGCYDGPSAFGFLWAHFTDLSFLNVRIRGGPAVTVRDVIRGARRVQLVGYDWQFREVIHRDGEPVLLPAWPTRMVELCEIKDFGCESWNWLMRHLVL
ncbi:uncharacterized protein B0H18DRAFT_478384 [Fomitopsis serialis]|uniref:uncharacterized protein n=1 Tax=Fomitopsis serialis TaxID=139415 RepID=UPI0020075E31|nr:uncharacterized protein B0H18DRAFT_478384 [Neoantrodia serialis]KAH9923044.1 hypothetical protein B0H18DRAFT_478384 [Neoantrodia serialis]